MSRASSIPDPAAIATLQDLARELSRLRRRTARPGQVQLSVRDIAARTGKAPSTLHPYLRGVRLCPADVYEEILRALGVHNTELRPWLDAWERLADAVAEHHPPTRAVRPAQTALSGLRPRPLSHTEEVLFSLADPTEHSACIGIVTGDLRRVRCADVWVNTENTNMEMARFEEYSISAIIRFQGAVRDDTGHVVDDCIADELGQRVSGRTPVAPGTAITTGAGELTRSNGIRYLVHVAAVHGEPGEGYRQVLDVGRCVTNALAEIDRLNAERPVSCAPLRSILFPLVGTGMGGGELETTVTALLGAALDYVGQSRSTTIQTVYFLAYTDLELEVCLRVFETSPRLVGPLLAPS